VPTLVRALPRHAGAGDGNVIGQAAGQRRETARPPPRRRAAPAQDAAKGASRNYKYIITVEAPEKNFLKAATKSRFPVVVFFFGGKGFSGTFIKHHDGAVSKVELR